MSGAPVLEQVSYEVDAAGGLAELTIRQTFVNRSDVPIDATYVFPLDDGASVDALRLRVGEREIRAEVRTREDARAVYDAAADAGELAVLTEQQRTNVFRHAVANLPPGVPIEVELHVVQPLDRWDGEWELVVPLVVAPRFAVAGEDAVEEGARTLGGPVAAIDLAIHAGAPLATVWSPSVPLAVAVDGGEARARLDVLAGDVVVRWKIAGREPALGLLVSGDVGMLLVEPPALVDRRERVPRELVWVLDTSCSMDGAPLRLAKAAMRGALRSMDPRDAFSVVGFADDVIGGTPAPATPDHVADGLAFVDRLEAGGGSRLGDALDTVLSWPADPTRRRTVVFVTDGLVSNDNAVLDTLAAHRDVTFVALGIGAAPNRTLLDGMAELGGGVAAYASLRDDPVAAMLRLVDAMDRPIWTDLDVDWGDCAPRELAPLRLPDVRVGRPARMLVRLDGPCARPVTVSATSARGRRTVTVVPRAIPRDRAMVSTWARERVADLERRERWGQLADASAEIAAIGLEAGIVTRETSLVAVDHGVRGPVADTTVAVPLALPDGTVSVEGAARGQVLTKETLRRIPTGRDDQSAVQSVPGVAASRIAATGLGGAVPGGATVRLGGFDVTDPVTPAFSAVLPVSGLDGIAILDGGFLPAVPGGQRVIELEPASGTNQLASRFGLAAARSDRVPGLLGTASVAGPLVRDRLFVHADGAAAERSFAGFVDRSTALSASLSGPGHGEHFVQGVVALEHADLATPAGTTLGRDGAVAVLSERWTPTGHLTSTLGAHASTRRLDDLVRRRVGAASDTVVERVGGRHDLGFGLAGWGFRYGDGAVTGGARRGSGYAQDAAQLGPDLRVRGGLRVDGRADPGLDVQLLVSPRGSAVWDFLGEGRSKLAGGVERDVDPNGLPGVPIARRTRAFGILEVEVVDDLALSASAATGREHLPLLPSPDRYGLPTGPVPELERDVVELEAGFRKGWRHRWTASGSWTWHHVDVPLGATDLAAAWIPGYLDPYRTHALRGAAGWDLPTDPWTLHLGVDASVASALPGAGGARWWLAARRTVGVVVEQDVDLREGELAIRGTLGLAVADPAASLLPMEAYALAPELPPLGAQPTGRGSLGVEYRF